MSLYGYDEPENEADYELCPVCLSEKDCNGALCCLCETRRGGRMNRWGEIADGLGLLVVLGFLMLCNCF